MDEPTTDELILIHKFRLMTAEQKKEIMALTRKAQGNDPALLEELMTRWEK